MTPLVLSCFECNSISILPILPVFCNSLRSSSGPKRPSVCPKTAPITSGFSTTPSISNFACITYFMVNACDEPVSVHLQVRFVRVNFNRVMRVNLLSCHEIILYSLLIL
jgi:hypothetical protein